MAEATHGNSEMRERHSAFKTPTKLPEHRIPDKIFIDATGTVLGRLASLAAKTALNGKKVVVLNCNKIVITGNKDVILKDFRDTMAKVRGRHKGPFYPKKPENLVRTSIAGMLPKTDRGRAILKNIEVYRDVPADYANNKAVNPEHLKKSEHVKKFTTIEHISSQITHL